MYNIKKETGQKYSTEWPSGWTSNKPTRERLVISYAKSANSQASR